MTTVNITLPEAAKAFLEEQVVKGGYASEGDYLLALLREARDRLRGCNLEDELLKGLTVANRPP